MANNLYVCIYIYTECCELLSKSSGIKLKNAFHTKLKAFFSFIYTDAIAYLDVTSCGTRNRSPNWYSIKI